MVITDVKIKLVSDAADKLLAFACVVFDGCFVVRDIKIIRGRDSLFVAMPSRKITDRCPRCNVKNHLQAVFCNRCGLRLGERRTQLDSRGRAKLHVDIAHPINTRCREELQKAVIIAYKEELKRSKQPNYVPQSLGDDDLGVKVTADRVAEAEVTLSEETAAPDAKPPAEEPLTPRTASAASGSPEVVPDAGEPATAPAGEAKDLPPDKETRQKRQDNIGFGIFS